MARVAKLLDGKAYTEKAEQIAAWVEKFFQDSGQTQWPTFRTVSYRCKISQTQLKEFCEEGVNGLMETQYNTLPATPLSEHFVEVCK